MPALQYISLVHDRHSSYRTIVDEMMLDIVWTVNLFFGGHLLGLFSGLLTIAVVRLQHGIIHWNLQLEAILISTAVLDSV